MGFGTALRSYSLHCATQHTHVAVGEFKRMVCQGVGVGRISFGAVTSVVAGGCCLPSLQNRILLSLGSCASTAKYRAQLPVFLDAISALPMSPVDMLGCAAQGTAFLY